MEGVSNMGLDMFALTTFEKPSSEVDFKISEARELHYWRKHPDLHGWMEALYREKGGEEESFNCVNVQLAESDIDRLEAALRGNRLPHTEGFFFGETDGSELEGDLDFIRKAREALEQGETLYYSSWW